MPPKRTYNNDSDDSESTATSSNESDEDVPVSNKPVAKPGGPAGGRSVANRPHDEEFDVGDERHSTKTPPQDALGGRKPSGSGVQQTITPASKSAGGSGGNVLRNNPNDETFDVEDDERHVQTPPRAGARPNNAPAPAAGGGGAAGGGAGRGSLRNNPHDEFEEVSGDETATPRQTTGGGAKPGPLSQQSLTQQQQLGAAAAAAGPGGSRTIRNDHHDEAIDISASPTSTNDAGTPPSTHKAPQPKGKMSMVPDEPDSSSEDEGRDHAPIKQPAGGLPPALSAGVGATVASKPNPTPEYNPADYASINQRASREMQDLFACIAAYQSLTQELPSKLRPFIPDFIPSVGDLDPFCKIPRPDGRPDNLGLHVVDEPSSAQSNPAVIKIWLNYIARSHVPSLFVESVEDAASKPNVIDKWVQDLKTLQKPLPSVTYTKPMPEIESLLQVWPPEFEELLNSDLQFPPSQIDLDIDQYVRVMCAILDIPTYGSVIESLHVIFTLYMEFRANQHFQHA